MRAARTGTPAWAEISQRFQRSSFKNIHTTRRYRVTVLTVTHSETFTRPDAIPTCRDPDCDPLFGLTFVFEGEGHNAMDNIPQQFAEVVMKFLQAN